MENIELPPEKAALIRAMDAKGGITSFARALGLSSHAVAQGWLRTRVPSEYCPLIEKMGLGVQCEDLRPDMAWDVLRANPRNAGNGIANVNKCGGMAHE